MDIKSIEFKLERINRVIKRLKRYKDEFLFKYGEPRAYVLEDIEEDERLRELIDLLILNYSKAQSILGEKLFKEVLEFSGVDVNKRFVEILATLEREGILNIDDWMLLRDLRNSFSHEYPEELEEMAKNLKLLFNYIDIIESVFNNLKEYYFEAKRIIIENRNNI